MHVIHIMLILLFFFSSSVAFSLPAFPLGHMIAVLGISLIQFASAAGYIIIHDCRSDWKLILQCCIIFFRDFVFLLGRLLHVACVPVITWNIHGIFLRLLSCQWNSIYQHIKQCMNVYLYMYFYYINSLYLFLANCSTSSSVSALLICEKRYIRFHFCNISYQHSRWLIHFVSSIYSRFFLAPVFSFSLSLCFEMRNP